MARGAYRLTVVAGPNRGATYRLEGDRVSIGRQSDNDVVLPSGQVSKRHCVLVADHGKLVLHDRESANGTFVNGVLSRERELKNGDRIGIGEFLLELSASIAAKVKTPKTPKASKSGRRGFKVSRFPNIGGAVGDALELPPGLGSGGGQVIPFPAHVPVPLGTSATPHALGAAPKSLKDKAIWFFENRVMPVFYGLNLHHEWRWILGALLVAFTAFNLLASVYPAAESGREMVLREAARRAQFMAKLLVERNAGFLAANQETRCEIGIVGREEGVRVAMVLDLDNRIIAPPERLNQYLTGGSEAKIAVAARELFGRGRETGFTQVASDGMIVAVEPIKIFNPQQGKNATVAMAVVSVDSDLSVASAGQLGVMYSQTFILTGLMALFIFFVIHRLTIKPLQVLNDDVDRVLKGDLPSISQEFRFAEIQPLFDVIRSALQRLPSGAGFMGAEGGATSGVTPSAVAEEALPAIKLLAEGLRVGVALCDASRKIVYLNPAFEELSGIRLDSSAGQELMLAARDQAQAALFSEHLEKAVPGGDAVKDEFEFASGSTSLVQTVALGSPMHPARGYLIAVAEGGGL